MIDCCPIQNINISSYSMTDDESDSSLANSLSLFTENNNITKAIYSERTVPNLSTLVGCIKINPATSANVNEMSQVGKNKKTVRFSNLVRVRRIPPKSDYEIQKAEMFWMYPELQDFKWEANMEIKSYCYQHNCSFNDAKFLLYQPMSSFVSLSIR